MKKVLSNFSKLNLVSSLQKTTNLSTLSSLSSSSTRCILSQPRTSLVDKSSVANFSLHAPRHGLMEFFDDKKNWSEMKKIKHGRPWRLDELRIKSNIDLHKLWYVLLKERNMLLTMEEFYIQNDRSMPSHERIAKV